MIDRKETSIKDRKMTAKRQKRDSKKIENN